ncbi:MAG: ABC transporter substrate-binding protein [Dehalococcoidales bacterium]|jgi:iron complex transport system substrate-binding protein|nr:ABC transporter substrate-binding protein [Dehalococcoidales bacterium]
MIKIKNFAIALMVVAVFLLAACNNSPAISTTPDTNKETITVTDSVGRAVEVPKKVEKIAALYSFAGYTVCLLGSGNDLVGVPGGLQRDILLVEIFPELANASTPRTGGTINIEELLRIDPDVVLVRKDTVADDREVEKLDKSGLPYIVVDYSTMEEQREAILIIGKAIGKEAEARTFNNYYLDTIDRVSQLVGDIPEGEKVRLYHSENQATRATHESSLAADWTRAAGVINVSVGGDLELVGNDYYASIEQILFWDPEVIIVNESTAYSLITSHPQWSGISAVREGKVCQLPNGISRWGHPGSVETPLALLWTAKTVYPELFTHVEMGEEVQYFYKTFFNMELDEEMIATVLRGGDLREDKQ